MDGYFFHTQSIMQPFLDEYRSIPAELYDQSGLGDDPVAVWQKEINGDLYFYAVNRLETAVTVRIDLSNVTGVYHTSGGGRSDNPDRCER